MKFSGMLVVIALFLSQTAADDTCKENGFIGSQACADCQRLVDYVGDQGLGEECQQCCREDESSSIRKFSKAVLDVCQYRLRDFPHIDGFINNAAAKFGALSISHTFGSYPRLILRSGKKRETIRIDHWKGENIEEYLRDRLEQPSKQRVVDLL